MVKEWRVEVPFFAPLQWWGKAFLAKHSSRVLKAVRVQTNRFRKKEFQAKAAAGAESPRQKRRPACLRSNGKEKRVARAERGGDRAGGREGSEAEGGADPRGLKTCFRSRCDAQEGQFRTAPRSASRLKSTLLTAASLLVSFFSLGVLGQFYGC